MKVIYSCYSTGRRKQYAISTQIIEENNQIFIRKSAQTDESVPHILQISENYEAIRPTISDQVHLSAYKVYKDHIDLEYIEGRNFLLKLDEAYQKGGFNSTIEQFEWYYDFINSFAKQYNNFNGDSISFKRQFGQLDLKDKKSVFPANINLLPSNIVLGDFCTIVDCEWICPYPIPLEFLLFRAIREFLLIYKIKPFEYDKMLEHFKISRDLKEIYTQMELRLNMDIFDKDSEYMNYLKDSVYIPEIVDPAQLAEKYSRLACLLIYNEERTKVDHINATMELLSQRDRLSQSIVAYRNIVENQQRALDEGIGIKLKRGVIISVDKAYRKLFGNQARDRFKNLVFKAGRPVLKNKALYREWEASGHPELADHAAAPKVLSLEEKYIKQIQDIREQKFGGDYVSKTVLPYDPGEADIKAIAFYNPAFYLDYGRNNAGSFGWSKISRAMPFFIGHYQPHLPGDLGYYDLKCQEAISKQMELARLYGIYGFCIYYYWSRGKSFLEKPLDVLYGNETLNLPFCLCWKNENLDNLEDLADNIAQDYSKEYMLEFAKSITPYLTDNRYIKINGKPVLLIYNPDDIKDLVAVSLLWRQYFRENGNGEISLIFVKRSGNPCLDIKTADAYLELPPYSIENQGYLPYNAFEEHFATAFDGNLYNYNQIPEKKYYLYKSPYKLFKSVMLGYDDTVKLEKKSAIFHHFSIKAYKEWLKDLIQYTSENFEQEEKLLFINAWNSWDEGLHLEPDTRYGYAYLQATRDCLEKSGASKKIIFVSHDAMFAGAQILSVQIVKQLVEVFGYEVYVILKHGGELIPEFQKYTKTILQIDRDIENPGQFKSVVKSWNTRKAICNTVVTGDVLGMLTGMGIECISLIHEMPSIIREMEALGFLEEINQKAKQIVFPSTFVKQSNNALAAFHEEKISIRPQGLFKINPLRDQIKKARTDLRNEFNLPEDAKIVLGAGIANTRKGFDLFAECAIKSYQNHDNYHFIWVGSQETDIFDVVYEKCRQTGVLDRRNLICVKPQKNIDLFFAGSNLFLLTSREDPFPSVVMDSMHVGVPVIAFKDSGGFADIVTEKTGMLVAKNDVKAMYDSLQMHLTSLELLAEKSVHCRKIIEENLNFVSYIYYLLELLDERYEKISVIVPNYNYARYLPERINSILRQTYPIFQIVLLDDCSTDNSREIIEELKTKYPLRIKTIFNEVNSKNVFAQWEKGLVTATGEYIWIAEADDLSEIEFVEKNMEKFKADSEIIMAYTQSKQIDTESNPLHQNYYYYTDDVSKSHFSIDYIVSGKQEIENALCIKNTIPNVSAVIFKNCGLDEVLKHSLNYKVAGDWKFYIKLLERGGKIAYSKDSLNIHRLHKKSVTRSLDQQRHFDEIVNVQDYVLNNYIISEKVKNKVMKYRKMVKKGLGLE